MPVKNRGSHISAHSYNPETQELDITFRGGKTYRYKDVPGDIVENFQKAPSQGKFHHSKIRVFDCHCIDPEHKH